MVPKYLPNYRGIHYGCDPEVFVTTEKGRVKKRAAAIGSEVLLPMGGVKVFGGESGGALTRDGVQIEMHPTHSHCRALLSHNISAHFRTLKGIVDARSKESGVPMRIDFRSLVKLTPGDMDAMSPDCRKLGCLESLNAYGHPHIKKDGEKYRIRTAAGHLHIGTTAIRDGIDPNAYAKIFDVWVGNQCVMVDRDPNAAIRRKTYGRAGEYRIPDHGFEYRTLSNFWLRHYVLMSMVFGLADVAHKIASTLVKPKTAYAASVDPKVYQTEAANILMDGVDLRLIEQAINTNDWELARSNYERWVKPFIEKTTGLDKGIGQGNMTDFEYLVDTIRKEELAGNDPLGTWFPEDPLTHWMTKPDGHGHGFENFMVTKVRRQRPVQVSGTIMLQGTIPDDIPDVTITQYPVVPPPPITITKENVQ